MIPPRPPPPPSLANPQTAPCPSSPPNQKAPQTHTPTETRIPLSITFDSSHRQNALGACLDNGFPARRVEPSAGARWTGEAHPTALASLSRLWAVQMRLHSPRTF